MFSSARSLRILSRSWRSLSSLLTSFVASFSLFLRSSIGSLTLLAMATTVDHFGTSSLSVSAIVFIFFSSITGSLTADVEIGLISTSRCCSNLAQDSENGSSLYFSCALISSMPFDNKFKLSRRYCVRSSCRKSCLSVLTNYRTLIKSAASAARNFASTSSFFFVV